MISKSVPGTAERSESLVASLPSSTWRADTTVCTTRLPTVAVNVKRRRSGDDTTQTKSPTPCRALAEIELPGQDPDGLPTVPHQPDCPGLKLRREYPSLAFGRDRLLPHFRAIWGVYQNRGR